MGHGLVVRAEGCGNRGLDILSPNLISRLSTWYSTRFPSPDTVQHAKFTSIMLPERLECARLLLRWYEVYEEKAIGSTLHGEH